MSEAGNVLDGVAEDAVSDDTELRQSNLYRQMQALLAEGYNVAARSIVRAEMARIAKIAFLAFADARRK
jgi:hypothetical protein